MNKQPDRQNSSALVTVIVPAYRAPAHLNAALESVVKQTYSPIEIMVIDDASGDEFTADYRLPRNARLICLKDRQGAAAITRNIGVRESRGKYVAFLDQDDLWSVDKIEVQVQALEAHPEAALHYVHCLAVTESAETMRRQPRARMPKDALAAFLWANWVHPSQVMMRRSAIEEIGMFDESIRGASDWDMWLRTAALGPGAVIGDPRPLAKYRHHGGQWSRSDLMMVKASVAVIAKARGWVTDRRPDLRGLVRRRHGKWLRELARVRMESGEELEQVWGVLGSAWRMSPLDWKVYRFMARALWVRPTAKA
ncbi:MAG TPA: glycosyltransferase family A protein [Phycisphaerae bacterium]|nr:glycosyltransferase family A protein [Phycisphaerae bacterium]